MNKLKRVCSMGFGHFGRIGAISLVVLALVMMLAPTVRIGFLPLGVIAAAICVVSFSIAAVCFLLLTQNRALHGSSILVKALSVTGISLIGVVAIYVIYLVGAVLLGIGTNAPIYGLASLWFKNFIIVGLVLLYVAFVTSYRPLRAAHIVAIMLAITTAVFSSLYFIDTYLYGRNVYLPFALVFGVGAVFAAIKSSEPKQQTGKK